MGPAIRSEHRTKNRFRNEEILLIKAETGNPNRRAPKEESVSGDYDKITETDDPGVPGEYMKQRKRATPKILALIAWSKGLVHPPGSLVC